MNRAVGGTGGDAVERWRGGLHFVQGQAAGPDERIGEVAVDVDPGVVLGEQGSCLFAASFGPKPLARKIIIVGFDDESGTFASGEEIADVFAGVVAFGNKSAVRRPVSLCRPGYRSRTLRGENPSDWGHPRS